MSGFLLDRYSTKYILLVLMLTHAILWGMEKEYDTSPVMEAIKMKDAAMVAEVIGAADKERRNFSGQTLLFSAVASGDPSVVRNVLRFGKIDVNVQDEKGNTALHYAVSLRNENVVKVLINESYRVPWYQGLVGQRDCGDVNIPNKAGQTPLHIAAKNGDVGIITYLLQAGAATTVSDYLGRIPLHYAAMHTFQVVQAVLGEPSDLKVKDHEGKTAADRAIDPMIRKHLQELLRNSIMICISSD